MPQHRRERTAATASENKPRRFSALIAILLLSLTMFNIISYHLHSSTSDRNSDNVESHKKHFDILNGTLSSLKEDLLLIKRNQASYRENSELNMDNTTTPAINHVIQMPKRKALLYTMDSILSYESASKQGGAAGEILVRKSLEKIFKELNVELDVKESDAEFESSDTSKYDFIIVDPWTWAAKGWVPKKHLRGMDNKMFILDFFGSKTLRGSGLNVPPSRFLTAYNTSYQNSFLGYFKEDDVLDIKSVRKQQGILWGKDGNHFDGKMKLIESLAHGVALLSTASAEVFDNQNITWLGHQNAEQWNVLLTQSRFLLGLGDPLLGPSAIDAVAAGCMYINPIYSPPVIHNDHSFASQHPHAAESIGEPYVCSYLQNDLSSLQQCVEQSMITELRPFIPLEFTKEAYRDRVIKIFGL